MTKKIAIFGAGYVGFSLGLLLGQTSKIIFIDNDDQKVRKINNNNYLFHDSLANKYSDYSKLEFEAYTTLAKIKFDFDYVILALPTNFNETKNHFETKALEVTIEKLSQKKFEGIIIIKSTVPIGFTEKMAMQYPNLSIFFVPEFLREGSAIFDNLNPSRIIVGGNPDRAEDAINLFNDIANNNPEKLLMTSSEAESVKLFSNTFLAMRIAFFNELDSFCLNNHFDTKKVINGVCLDRRIGSFYNNPSFGYGGYCLPKDSKQLLANFGSVPQGLLNAIITSNKIRKDHIASYVLSLKPNTVGIFRLTMKKDSDNFRDSAILDIINLFLKEGIKVLVYEPLIGEHISYLQICNDLSLFKQESDIILANRYDETLEDVQAKLFSRDIFHEN